MTASIAAVTWVLDSLSALAGASSSAGDQASDFNALGTFAAVGSAIVTIATVIYARRAILSAREIHEQQISDQLKRECRLRVDQYLARLNDVDFLPLIAQAEAFLIRTPHADRQKPLAQLLPLGTIERLEVLAVLNFFEEVADQYLAGMLDDDAALRVLGYTAEVWWHNAEWFILRIRGGGTEPLGRWEQFVREVWLKRMLDHQRPAP